MSSNRGSKVRICFSVGCSQNFGHVFHSPSVQMQFRFGFIAGEPQWMSWRKNTSWCRPLWKMPTWFMSLTAGPRSTPDHLPSSSLPPASKRTQILRTFSVTVTSPTIALHSHASRHQIGTGSSVSCLLSWSGHSWCLSICWVGERSVQSKQSVSNYVEILISGQMIFFFFFFWCYSCCCFVLFCPWHTFRFHRFT